MSSGEQSNAQQTLSAIANDLESLGDLEALRGTSAFSQVHQLIAQIKMSLDKVVDTTSSCDAAIVDEPEWYRWRRAEH